jgi:hypothetical protein
MLSRINYFTGRLLTAADLLSEQEYFLEKLRRHNRLLHRPGVVGGLDVSVEPSGIRVDPGLAVDAAGNEICVPTAQTIAFPAGRGEVYLALHYAEIGIDLIPVPGSSGGETPGCLPSRIQESFTLGFAPPGTEPPSPPPPQASPPVRLARLRRTRGRWTVDSRFRRPKAR